MSLSLWRDRPLEGGAECRQCLLVVSFYWQVANFIDAIRVCQLKLPLFAMYSWVYQKVESSDGSTFIVE